MTTFDKTSYTIRVECGCNPIENWMILHNTLLELISIVDMNNLPENLWIVADFLTEMLPPEEVLRKVVKEA